MRMHLQVKAASATQDGLSLANIRQQQRADTGEPPAELGSEGSDGVDEDGMGIPTTWGAYTTCAYALCDCTGYDPRVCYD
jgi:hypothetical protein